MTPDPTGQQLSPERPSSTHALNASIRQAFARVVYAHKTHEKAREIEDSRVGVVKWANIVLTTLTSAGLLGTIITNAHVLLYTSSALSAVALVFLIFQLSFDPVGAADKHRATANELWWVREKFNDLLTDLKRGVPEEDIAVHRDQLTERLKEIYSRAPSTSSRAYKKAPRALEIPEENTFTADEINRFLPKELHEPD